jgi:hypothetical protein
MCVCVSRWSRATRWRGRARVTPGVRDTITAYKFREAAGVKTVLQKIHQLPAPPSETRRCAAKGRARVQERRRASSSSREAKRAGVGGASGGPAAAIQRTRARAHGWRSRGRFRRREKLKRLRRTSLVCCGCSRDGGGGWRGYLRGSRLIGTPQSAAAVERERASVSRREKSSVAKYKRTPKIRRGRNLNRRVAEGGRRRARMKLVGQMKKYIEDALCKRGV